MNALPGTLRLQDDNSYFIDHAPRYYLQDERYYYSFRIVHPVDPQKGVDVSINPNTGKPHIKVDIETQPDLLIAGVDKIRKNKQPVSLEFNHLLTQVAFTIKKAPGVTAEIYLNKITVEGHHKAEISYPHSKFNHQSYSGSKQIDVFQAGIGLFPIRETAQEVSHVLLLPQTSGEDNSYKFTVELSDGRKDVFHLPVKSAWEAGVRYRYHLNVLSQGTNVELDTQIESWRWDGEVY